MYTAKIESDGIRNAYTVYSEPEYKSGFLMAMSAPLCGGLVPA
jgi:hypothetical protein